MPDALPTEDIAADPAGDRSVLGRVITILDTVADAPAPLALAALTRRTGMPKPTVRRIANALVERGMLSRTAEGYWIGARLVDQALLSTRQQRFAATIQPYLQDLHGLSRGMGAWFAEVRDDDLVVTASVLSRTHQASLDRTPWPRLSRYGPGTVLTAAGRLLIADDPELTAQILDRGCTPLTRYSVTDHRLPQLLERARSDGFAKESEQVMLGWGCAAVPVRDRSATLIGVLGVIGRAAGTEQPGLRRSLQRLSADLQSDLRRLPNWAA